MFLMDKVVFWLTILEKCVKAKRCYLPEKDLHISFLNQGVMKTMKAVKSFETINLIKIGSFLSILVIFVSFFMRTTKKTT